jgi:hypothetical protein
MSGFPTPGTPYVGSTGGDGPSGFPVFREVNLDSRQGILDVFHHPLRIVFLDLNFH